ncbi:MAG: malonyl-ACP O-methyltransferase BioC [Gammaproteobacteria bacterium]
MTIEPQAYQVDKRRVRRAFDDSAARYDDVAVLQREVGRRLLARLDVLRTKPGTILDVGAGTGQAARDLLRRYRGSRVVALDVSMAMLRKAAHARSWLHKPLAVCADMESLPIATGRVDMIYSNLTLQWCNDLERALREMRRVLSPGGVLLFTTVGPDTLNELRASWAAADTYIHVNNFIDMHDVGDAVMRAGFADPVMEMDMMRLTYRGVAQLMRELKLLGAHNSTYGRPRGLTGKQRYQRVRQAYERFRTREGVLPASYEIVYGLAWAGQSRPSARDAAGEVRIPLNRIQGRGH